jgi:hypothetical protein
MHHDPSSLFSGSHTRYAQVRPPLDDVVNGWLKFSLFSYPVTIIISIILLCLSMSIHNANFIAIEARKRRVMELLNWNMLLVLK